MDKPKLVIEDRGSNSYLLQIKVAERFNVLEA